MAHPDYLSHSAAIPPHVHEALRDALARGLGRAVRLLNEVPSEAAQQALLAACVRNTVYDPQCEPSRAFWLYELACRHGWQAALREAAAAELRAAPPAERDQRQLVELLLALAADHDRAARNLLYELLTRKGFATYEPAHAVVVLDGVAGFVDVARLAGTRLTHHEVYALASVARDQGATVEALLDALRPHVEEPGAAAAAAALADEQDRRAARRLRRPRTQAQTAAGTHGRLTNAEVEAELERWMRRIETADGPPAPLPVQVARAATDEQLWPLVAWLMAEMRPPQVLRLLATFRLRALPVVPERVLGWARGGSDAGCSDAEAAAIQTAAIWALSNAAQPDVRALALELLGGAAAGRALQAGAARLLRTTYRDGDAALLLAALREVQASVSADTRHEISSSLLDVARGQADPALGGVLEWVYEHTPCTVCRRLAVQELIAREALSAALAEECTDDADAAIRELAAAYRERGVWYWNKATVQRLRAAYQQAATNHQRERVAGWLRALGETVPAGTRR